MKQKTPDASKLVITKDTTIKELLDRDPTVAEFLSGHGLFCGHCPFSQMETIEQGALVHGIEPEELIERIKAHSEYN